jgi:dTDP-4-dehydrorhamnose reductase
MTADRRSYHPEPFDDTGDLFDEKKKPVESTTFIGTQPEGDELEHLMHQEFRPKVLVTGAKGQLGADIADALKDDFESVLTDVEEMDITNPSDVQANFALHEPDVVIHAAAYTNVDGCESNQEDAFRINAIGTQNIALACQDSNAVMIYISTDYIFDGTSKKPYREFMSANPINVYGQSKLMGEQIVRSHLEKHFIVRTSWLFGAHGHNFVKTMLRLSTEKKEISVVNDQRGRPTYSRDLADAIVKLMDSSFYGTYHVANVGETSWYEFARKILELAGRDTKVKPITTDQYPTPAKRPAYSVLDDFIWKLRGFEPLRHWELALSDFLNHPQVLAEFPFLKREPLEP